MTTFLELAGPPDDSDVVAPPAPAPAKKKVTFLDLAGPPPKAPTFSDVANPAQMRADIAAHGGSGPEGRALLAAFDAKFPNAANPPAAAAPAQAGAGRGTTPASAYAPPLHGAEAIPGYQAPAPRPPEPSTLQKVVGGHEAALTALTGMTTGFAGGITGGLKSLMTGQDPGQGFDEGARAMTYAPRTASGQDQAETVGNAMSYYGPQFVGIGPEIGMAGEFIGGRARLARAEAGAAVDAVTARAAGGAAPRVEPTMEAPASAAPAAKFSEAPAPTGGVATTAEQQRRAQVLSSVGLDQARKSALTGNAKDAANDAQMAKLDNPAGNAIRAQLDNEKAVLANHADGLVKATGGTQGLDQSTLFSRGNSIVSPLDALKEHFDTQTSALYKAADARAQGVPADMPATHSYIGGDQAEFLGTSEGEQLLKGVKARMKSLGMADAEGNPTAATVQQSEQLKQYLNNQWQPRTARLIRGMKDAIDDDVTKAAGDDIYQQARQMRAQRAATLDNPNGIAKVMDSSGPDGVNRSVPIEKIPDAIAGMPVKQFGHIVETLKGVPEEIQPQAAAALSEIKAHFANKVQAVGASQAGQWNAKGVTKFLNNNSERMAQVFTPEEMAQFHNLNDAGHILAKDQSYPGAAVQQHNLAKAGVLGGFTSAGGAAGGALAGPPGAAVGSWLGAKAGTAINEAASLRAAKSRLMSLKDVGK